MGLVNRGNDETRWRRRVETSDRGSLRVVVEGTICRKCALPKDRGPKEKYVENILWACLERKNLLGRREKGGKMKIAQCPDPQTICASKNEKMREERMDSAGTTKSCGGGYISLRGSLAGGIRTGKDVYRGRSGNWREDSPALQRAQRKGTAVSSGDRGGKGGEKLLPRERSRSDCVSWLKVRGSILSGIVSDTKIQGKFP